MSEPYFIDRIKLKSSVPDDSYLKSIPAVKYLEKAKELVFNSNVTIFTGENGSGKSTLIEAIAVACGFMCCAPFPRKRKSPLRIVPVEGFKSALFRFAKIHRKYYTS